MSSPQGVDSPSLIIIRGATKLSRPYHQSLIQHPSGFEITYESRHWLINASNACTMASFEIIVTVPSSTEDLNETHSLLHQSSGHQALSTEGRSLFVI